MTDAEIYKKGLSVLEEGENIALITIISTSGSTPAKPGTKMLVWGDLGETLGTVGGGCIEAEIITRTKNILPKKENKLITFNLTEDEIDESSICGGSMEVLIETFDKNSKQLFKDILKIIENEEKGVLISFISKEKLPNKILLKIPKQTETNNYDIFPPEITESITKVLKTEQPTKKMLKDKTEVFIEAVAEQPMLFLIGAGHISYFITKFAKTVGFRVTVCDDRIKFANKKRFPDADRIIVENFNNIFNTIEINKNSYIVIVTRGHKFDELALEKAVKTDARYIGMIGSKRKVLIILKRLKERGIPDDILKKVYTPIGLSIGAVTPEEIALSIVSELIKIRRIGYVPEIKHMADIISSLDR